MKYNFSTQFVSFNGGLTTFVFNLLRNSPLNFLKMKTYLLPLLALLLTGVADAQTELAPDQNPSFAISRDKYMQMADSLTRWHSTTLQNTYEAIDFLADREKLRTDRREFRQQLRLERARWNNYNYLNDGNFYSPYNNFNNSWRNPYGQFRNYRWQRNRFWWW
jgi:hypothetical protein